MSASFSKREQAQLREKAGDFIYTEEGSARVNVYANLLSIVNLFFMTMTCVQELPVLLLCIYLLIDCDNVCVYVCSLDTTDD